MTVGVLSDSTTKSEKITFVEEMPLIGLFGSINEQKLVSLGIILLNVDCEDSDLEPEVDEIIEADEIMEADE